MYHLSAVSLSQFNVPHADVPQLTEEIDLWDPIFSFHYAPAGFLVKADSEGNKGPIGYNRTEADGANLLARALPDGGVVMWRAFVYGNGSFIGHQLSCYWHALPTAQCTYLSDWC